MIECVCEKKVPAPLPLFQVAQCDATLEKEREKKKRIGKRKEKKGREKSLKGKE